MGITVDTSAASAALDELLVLAHEAAFNASSESAQEIRGRTQALLLAQWHPQYTPTPSRPGEPPAAISGELAASVIVTDNGESAFVGPTTDYGRIQELGGWMQGHPFMRWQAPQGRWHYSAGHDLPERPYLKPATESAIADGSIERIFIDQMARAIEEL
jgi:phage gpG-like protein